MEKAQAEHARVQVTMIIMRVVGHCLIDFDHQHLQMGQNNLNIRHVASVSCPSRDARIQGAVPSQSLVVGHFIPVNRWLPLDKLGPK
jgi:hypothetical protein